MSLLQHPLSALNQIKWYLDNRHVECFPGAFLLSAGNLARQVLEQVLFILAFYSGMPQNTFLKSNGKLRDAHHILVALREIDPATGLNYIEIARLRGPRIRKLARHVRSLDKWRRMFNEPSHFSNPGAQRKIREQNLRQFVDRLAANIEQIDGFLIIAAINELRSQGTVRAILGKDARNTPGVECDVVVTPNDLELIDGRLSLKSRPVNVQVVPNDQEVPYRWRKRVVLVQHSHGMTIGMRMLTESGTPVNLTNAKTVLETFSLNPRDHKKLMRRLKKLGINFKISSKLLK